MTPQDTFRVIAIFVIIGPCNRGYHLKLHIAVFLKIMKTTTLQRSTQTKGKGCYGINITKCLWHDACVRFECRELCPLFCDVDDVTYGGLRKIGFSRTKTLGYDGDCCDFHFYQKRSRPR